VAPLVLLLPETYLCDALRDQLFKQQRDRPTLVTTGKLLMPGSSTSIVSSNSSASTTTSSANLNRGWRGFLRSKRESVSSTSSSESGSDGAPSASYVWSMLSATAQVFPAATAVFTLFALSVRDSVTGKPSSQVTAERTDYWPSFEIEQ